MQSTGNRHAFLDTVAFAGNPQSRCTALLVERTFLRDQLTSASLIGWRWPWTAAVCDGSAAFALSHCGASLHAPSDKSPASITWAMPRASLTLGLVDLRMQHRPHVPRLDTDHRQACFSKRARRC